MMARHRGILLGIGLAAGIAIGTAGTVLGGGPTPSADPGSWPTGAGTMGNAGMMSGAGTMGNLDAANVAQMVADCDRIHDSVGASPGPAHDRMHDAMLEWMGQQVP
jgi:hypothetical protein